MQLLTRLLALSGSGHHATARYYYTFPSLPSHLSQDKARLIFTQTLHRRRMHLCKMARPARLQSPAPKHLRASRAPSAATYDPLAAPLCVRKLQRRVRPSRDTPCRHAAQYAAMEEKQQRPTAARCVICPRCRRLIRDARQDRTDGTTRADWGDELHCLP